MARFAPKFSFLSRSHAYSYSMRSKSTLILAEHNQGKLKETNKNLVFGARNLKCPSDLIIFGPKTDDLVEQAKEIPGLNKIYHCEYCKFGESSSEAQSAALSNFMLANKDYTNLIGPGSDYGRNILPRASAMLGYGMVSEVVKFESEAVFKRMVYAGDLIQTVQILDPIKILSLRCSAFQPEQFHENCANEVVEIKESDLTGPFKIENTSKFISQKVNESKRPELGSAKVIVSGGRGFKSKEEFQVVYDLADELGAAVGASRAIVDGGIAPNDMQVGQTGKIVSPDLYLALGISGAVQHIAGMKDSRLIVAINSDADAQIFEYADIGLVGDVKQIVPELIRMIREERK